MYLRVNLSQTFCTRLITAALVYVALLVGFYNGYRRHPYDGFEFVKDSLIRLNVKIHE